jgi:hypothetical protein
MIEPLLSSAEAQAEQIKRLEGEVTLAIFLGHGSPFGGDGIVIDRFIIVT